MAELTVDYRGVEATKLNNETGDKLQNAVKGGAAPLQYMFAFTNDTGGTIAADSIIELGEILGPCVVDGQQCFIETTGQFGASATIDIGLQEYKDEDGTVVVSNIDALVDGADASSAITGASANNTFNALSQGSDNLAKNGGLAVTGKAKVLLKILGDTMADGESIYVTITTRKKS